MGLEHRLTCEHWIGTKADRRAGRPTVLLGMQQERMTPHDDESVPTYDHRRLSIASDLLADVVPHQTEVSLFGYRLRKRTPGGRVWEVIDDDAGAIDAVNLEGPTSATALLDHLDALREASEVDA